MVTVGMNYDVLEGKQNAFESVFARVLEIMGGLPGHQHTELFRSVTSPRSYLIVSQWSNRADFDAFIKSDQFLKVADWGKSQILASRPRHEVYGDSPSPAPAASGGCPAHA